MWVWVLLLVNRKIFLLKSWGARYLCTRYTLVITVGQKTQTRCGNNPYPACFRLASLSFRLFPLLLQCQSCSAPVPQAWSAAQVYTTLIPTKNKTNHHKLPCGLQKQATTTVVFSSFSKFTLIKRTTVSKADLCGWLIPSLNPWTSTMNSSILVLSTCFRKLCPMPTFTCAPSISPGRSAMEIWASERTRWVLCQNKFTKSEQRSSHSMPVTRVGDQHNHWDTMGSPSVIGTKGLSVLLHLSQDYQHAFTQKGSGNRCRALIKENPSLLTWRKSSYIITPTWGFMVVTERKQARSDSAKAAQSRTPLMSLHSSSVVGGGGFKKQQPSLLRHTTDREITKNVWNTRECSFWNTRLRCSCLFERAIACHLHG